MCGIFGFFSESVGRDPASARNLVQKAADLMISRGPDGEGFWSDQKFCALSFRRLAILDLSSSGSQPMTTREGRYVLVYNGEVYNFREIRSELEDKGIKFKSSSDTEVVLQSLVYWGKEALNLFNGMFALAFYDSLEKRLLLARDHAAIKPLYYLHNSEGIVFASQYDQILAHPWARNYEVSQESLSLYLNLGFIPSPYGILKNTFMMEAGSWLETDLKGQVTKGKFYEFPVYKEPDLRGNEAYDAVNDAVTRAVKRQLVSDVPVGAFLSGGIDSPLVAAKIKALNAASVKVFTLGVPGDPMDESADAALYAKELGVEHIVEHVSQQEALSMLDEVVHSCGEPFADYSIFPTLLISRIARRHVKVMLSGDGGDELFWGYVARFGSVLEKAKDFKQPYALRWMRWWARRMLRGGGGYRYSSSHHSIGAWYLQKHMKLPENVLSRIFPELTSLPSDFKDFHFRDFDIDKTAQWLRWNEYYQHLAMVLLKVDRGSMANSLEVRVPLLDREVVDIASRVDWKSCLDVKNRIGKIPLRQSLARHVNHRTAGKRGFAVPMADWLRGNLKPVFEGVISGRKEILGTPINQSELRSAFKAHQTKKADLAWGLWMILSLFLWEKNHYKK